MNVSSARARVYTCGVRLCMCACACAYVLGGESEGEGNLGDCD